jgi:hypothetical protein
MPDPDSGKACGDGEPRPVVDGAVTGVRCDRCAGEGGSRVGEEFLCAECFQLAGACCAGGERDC